MVLKYLLVFIVFSAMGLGLEVIFTATFSKNKDRVHMLGFSSLYYVPLYGIALPIFIALAYPFIRTIPWYMRGLIYLPFIHICEYCGMLLLRKINGASPSEGRYQGKRWSIHNLTRIDFVPVFYAMGIFFEFLLRILLDEKLS